MLEKNIENGLLYEIIHYNGRIIVIADKGGQVRMYYYYYN